MSFGIDTFRSRLDLLSEIRAAGDFAAGDPNGSFFVWNGGSRPSFAGRNFLGGDFIWGHAEATNVSSQPDIGHYPLAATDLSPEQPQNLKLLVNRIAPIQAPDSRRQQITRARGQLFGQIDADAICKRLVAAIVAGELRLSEAELMQVWLAVDSTAPFSADYWAGWADKVNNAVLPIKSEGSLIAQLQPFRAAILCRYVAGSDGKFRPEPQVTAALASRHQGMDTRAHGFWADLPQWTNAPANLAANESSLLDWSRFDPPTAPILWRIARGFTQADGSTPAVSFDVDAANPSAEPLAFMFDQQTWQPNVPSLQNPGFSNSDAITSAQATCLQTTQLPAMNDNNFHANAGHFNVPGGLVAVIGRYINIGGVNPQRMDLPEAQRLSGAGFSLFTIWQGPRRLAGVLREANSIDYFNPDPDGNPATHDDAGTQDGTDAFAYCGNTLGQPSQTPVFFATDFDPYDPPGLNNESFVKTYFEKIKAARDAYSTQTGRHYLIGVYGVGKLMQALYAQGFVSHFWQSGSSGRNGNHPPNWPWFHTNRWQYQADKALCGIGGVNPTTHIPFGLDPDVDWGDGGTWSTNDPLAQEFAALDLHMFLDSLTHWGNLLHP